MITLQQFLDSHGEASMRVAREDDIFNECLVLQFDNYVQAYDPTIGTIEGYIMMRLKFAVMKYHAKEARHRARYREELPDVVQRSQEPVPDSTALDHAFIKLESDLQLTLEMWANGRTQEEIADELGIGVRKVRARISAGITALRKELTGEV